MFKVIKEVEVSKSILKTMVENGRQHLQDRQNRLDLLDLDTLTIWKSFFVDKDHADGIEVHIITDKADIIVCNVKDRSAITVLHARPMQIKRYINERVPSELWERAKLNVDLGLNEI